MNTIHTSIICASRKHPILVCSLNIFTHWDQWQIVHNFLIKCGAGGILQLANSTCLHTDRTYRNSKIYYWWYMNHKSIQWARALRKHLPPICIYRHLSQIKLQIDASHILGEYVSLGLSDWWSLVWAWVERMTRNWMLTTERWFQISAVACLQPSAWTGEFSVQWSASWSHSNSWHRLRLLLTVMLH